MAQLEVTNLALAFGGLQALRGVSFSAERGELLSLIGPNGAGKTTVFNCISGIYRPDAGSIRFRGRELCGLRPDRVARCGVARTFQNIELFSQMTALDNLLLGRHLHLRTNLLSGAVCGPGTARREMEQRRRVDEILDLLDLRSVRHRIVSSLPYGTQKMLELGRALCQEPKLLLLDEPAAGLTTEEKRELARRIGEIRAEFGATILLVEHDLRLVMELSDRVLALSDGEAIACAEPAELRRHPEVLRAGLGEEAGATRT